jgi:hypothetical protein
LWCQPMNEDESGACWLDGFDGVDTENINVAAGGEEQR